MLTQEKLKEVLSYNPQDGTFVWIKRCIRSQHLIGRRAGSNKGRGYIRIIIGCKKYYAHRLAWLYMYGSWPEHTIDHIDGNTSNNAISNLRSVEHLDNMRNMKKHCTNTSGATGVTWSKSKQKWRAQIHIADKGIFLGYFVEKQAAIAARMLANKQYNFHANHGR